ncbi:hypothetical protein M9Y10_044546 [Tritrichomonas musculus]|uniref:Uncharacterized protein n=1 Tax=Tritrichomonas musculus TaxID=1915356 RepID=A0ABR2JTF5_9EUKA
MSSFISSFISDEVHQNSGAVADLELNKNAKNSDQIKLNSADENQSSKNNENNTIKKIHHNISSFSELSDFFSEPAQVILNKNSSEPEKNTQPKQVTQNKRKNNSKKKPQKRQPIKIDFSKIFEQDNIDFLDDSKEKNTDTINKHSNMQIENEAIDDFNPNTKKSAINQENNVEFSDILCNIENRIIDYFNRSVNLMISEFIYDLKTLLGGMNSTDSLIKSFGTDLKKNIRQIINFRTSRQEFFEYEFIDSHLLSFKNLFLDVHQNNPNKMNKIHELIKDCRRSILTEAERMNSKLTPSIDQLHKELSELHQFQQSTLQREIKSDLRHSSILQQLADLEYSEMMQKAESDLFALRISRSSYSFPKQVNDTDKTDIMNHIYKFVKYYKHLQNNFYYKDAIKQYSKMITDTSDDFQHICFLYNQRLGVSFNTIKYTQNIRDSAFISNFHSTIIAEQLNMSQNNITNQQNSMADNNNNENRNVENNKDSKEIGHDKVEPKKKKKISHKNYDAHKSMIKYTEDLRHHKKSKTHHKYFK